MWSTQVIPPPPITVRLVCMCLGVGVSHGSIVELVTKDAISQLSELYATATHILTHTHTQTQR